MSEYRRSGSTGRNPLPAIGAAVATVAVVGALAFVVLGSSSPPDPERPTPVGTAISAPEQREVALAVTPTMTPPPTVAPPTATPPPQPSATPAPAETPAPRAVKPTRTPRPGLPPTATPLPNVQVTPSPTAARPSATAMARATQTAEARRKGTPGAGDAEVLEPVDGGTVDVAWDESPSEGSGGEDAALVEPVYEEVVPAEQPQAADSGTNSGFDALATAQAQQGVYQEPVYQEPVYQDPAWQQPVFQEPVFDSPVFDEPIVVEIPDIVVPTPNIPQYVTPGRNLTPRETPPVAGKPAREQPEAKSGKNGKSARGAKDSRRQEQSRSSRQSQRGDGKPGNNGRHR